MKRKKNHPAERPADIEADSVADAPADTPETEPRPEPTVVAIGASAGGLAALRRFFSHVPADSGLAYVVVVHLSPEHKSHLADLLQPFATIPAQQVTETVPLEPNRIYLIPPGANLSTIDTHLRLSDLEEQRRERAPIDHFFRTLAASHDEQSIGVILTGTGSDGTMGLRKIKERGGLTIVQHPNDAEYDGMPQSAIATGLVDLILPLGKIPDAILRYVRTKPRVPPVSDDRPLELGDHGRLLQKIFAQIRARTGRDFTQYKRSMLMRRIQRRMQLRHVEDLDRYVDLLRKNPEEVVSLADDFLITVTSFFRSPDVFQMLESEIIPKIFEGKTPDQSVRVWTVGCATGEESYSLAILLFEEAMRRGAPLPQSQIFASDLHEQSLTRAREGFYPGDIEPDLTPERLRRYFEQENGGFRIRKEIRELVVFAPHNLLSDPPFSKLDLISCRNLLIYLQREVQREIVELFHYALRPGGYLLLGPSETVEGTELFRLESKPHALYRRRNTPASEPRLPVFPLGRLAASPGTARVGRAPETAAFRSLHQRMVESFGPPSMLVSPENKIVHLSERAGRFLAVPGGELSVNAVKLIREELRIELRAALHAVQEMKDTFRSKTVNMKIEGVARQVRVSAWPATEPDREGFALVVFEEAGQPEAVAPPGADQDRHISDTRVRELEAELELTSQRMQAIIEEYETSQEMHASNEELQSANEELRSTMEELETSKEELQSMNEELQTVNQENRHKVEELAQLSGDLQNLFSATEIATLFLDRDQRILRFTPQVSELFNVRMTDCGRPITDLTHRLGYEELQIDARRVLSTLIPIEREVQDVAGRWYLTRLLPYRSTDDRIEGVVITFIDVTTRKQAEDAVRELNRTLEERVAERTEQVQDLARRLTLSEQEERRRISRILHDDLQQLLYAVEMKLSVIRQRLPEESGTVAHELGEARDLIDQAVATTRQLTVDMSPPILHKEGLADALAWLQRPMRELHGLDIDLQVRGDVVIPDEDLRVFFFQTVRELLFNVKKHAGIDKATVTLADHDGHLVIHVDDEGNGFDVGEITARGRESSFGLVSARERLQLLGGKLEVTSEPGKGTHITIHAPRMLEPPESAED